MNAAVESRTQPLVSVVLATHERPAFLPIALACYAHQSYARRELIVVDDGAAHPVPEEAVRAAGGRLIRQEPGTPLGTKLNVALETARGLLCLKMDDDDWYAPRFLERLVAAYQAERRDRCHPMVAYMDPVFLFDLARWELRESAESHLAGGTLLFARDDWEEQPFRRIPRNVDFWFVLDRVIAEKRLLRVDDLGSYVQVRHGSGHLWAWQTDGRTIEEFMLDLPLHTPGPEALLPEWVLAIYRQERPDATVIAGSRAAPASPPQPVCPLGVRR